MVQIDKKDIIQHFLLNLFTILNIEINELNINNRKKERLSELIKTASLILSNESIFLDKKPELFLQKVSLNEIIDITCSVYKEKIREKNIKIKPLESNYWINIDKHYFSEGFKYLIKELLEHTSFIEFKYDEGKKTLYINHDNKNILKKTTKPLTSCLNVKNITKNEITYQLALAMLKMHNVKVKFNSKQISIELLK